MKAELSRNYISVRHEGCPSYGGSQHWFGGMIRICGCGVIGAADLIWYLKKVGNLTPEAYDRYVRRIRRSFFLIPFRGIPGFLMVPVLRLCLWKNRLPYRTRWGSGRAGIRKAAAAMLQNDIPVPVCIGPCLYKFLAAPLYRGLKFYEKRPEQDTSIPDSLRAKDRPGLVWTRTVRNHFVVMTGIDGKWARISSWGKEYYIDLDELEAQSRWDALGLFTNIIRIR